MVLGAIYLPDGVIPPARAVPVQLLHQSTDELAEAVCIRVGLVQLQVQVAEGVQRDDHADARVHHIQRQGLGIFFSLPNLPLIIGLPQPRFIDVEDSFSISEQVQHLHSELLAHKEIPNRVRLFRQLLDLAVFQVHFLFESLYDMIG